MKLTVLGGGGVRSAFLAKSLAYNAHRIGLEKVVFSIVQKIICLSLVRSPVIFLKLSDQILNLA